MEPQPPTLRDDATTRMRLTLPVGRDILYRKPQAASRKPQAASRKPQAASRKPHVR